VKILFIGDIVGSPGRKIVHDRLADILSQRGVDLCIANGENSASGVRDHASAGRRKYSPRGAEVITGGNHIWDRKEIFDFFSARTAPDPFPPISRTARPGKGHYVGRAKKRRGLRGAQSAGARTFMTPLEDPFRAAERELAALSC
jgi:calcineurin-like phosphoesterase